MQDIYAALMGEPVSEEEKMQALARKLATQRSMGQTGQILGGRLLKAPAEQMIGAADESAGELAKFAGIKRNQEQNAMMAEEARIDRAKAAELDRQFRAAEAAKDRSFEATQKAQDRALSRALAVEKKKGYSLPAQLADKLANEASEVQGINLVTSNFKPQFAGAGVPGVRGVKNWVASKGLGTEADKEAQQWWADWEKAYTLPTRNKMFGSALTAPERKAWAEANITKDMTPEQIQKNLETIEGLRQRALNRKKAYYVSKGADPDELDVLFGTDVGESFDGSVATPEGPRSSRTKYYVGQEITVDGKTYRVTGGDLNNDPDVEEI